MKRNHFIKKGLLGMGTIFALPTAISCSEDSIAPENENCTTSPPETAGPFPIKTPAELVRENIIADRIGIALLITLTIQDSQNECAPLSGVYVDIWHCDKDGNYSEYGGLTSAHFLRGRQMTDPNGQVSFLSIYPGWYPGRAPHIHLEVLDTSENSLLISQIAFQDNISNTVYSDPEYVGIADTTNSSDGVFRNSLDGNMADALTGNNDDGYVLLKTITV